MFFLTPVIRVVVKSPICFGNVSKGFNAENFLDFYDRQHSVLSSYVIFTMADNFFFIPSPPNGNKVEAKKCQMVDHFIIF